jgi:hypothetical protein
MDAEGAERLSDLMALPYVQGRMSAPAATGVSVYYPDVAQSGLNVFSSGHTPSAFVMDMAGNVLHTWHYDYSDVWPHLTQTRHSEFWRRVHAYPNGDLLAIFEGAGMIKLDRESRLLWEFQGWCHHDMAVADDGRIFVLTRRGKMLPRISSEPVLEDYITVLDSTGHMISEHSLLECMENSLHSKLLATAKNGGDVFHTNSLYILEGQLENQLMSFGAGNLLVSMRRINLLAVADITQDRLVWISSARPGSRFWAGQHDPRPLDNGNLLMFDNWGKSRPRRSRAVEFDPRNNRIAWQYKGTPDAPLWSPTCGTVARLPNGNTLITESDAGRALEVTHALEVVWEFYNTHRAGDHGELIATLFEVERVPNDYFDWISAD